jgi:hypothetical protein
MHYLRLIGARKVAKKHVALLKARRAGHHSIPIYYNIQEQRSRKTKTLSACSCWMCGNPRKYFSGKNQLTMQERKTLLDRNIPFLG